MALTRDDFFWNAFIAHAKLTSDSAALLEQMLERPQEATELYRQIERLEADGDKITHEVITTLHQTWITPLDREWIHGLISTLDDVLDFIDSAGERFTLYEIEGSRPDALELAKVLRAAAAEMTTAVAALPKLKDGPALLALCAALGRHERQADRIFRRGIADLFKQKTEPLELMKWRDVYEALEASCDRIEDVAHIIEGIVLEHA